MKNQNSKIFIIDDEPLLVEMLSDFLGSKNEAFQIQSFPTGESSLPHFEENPSLIILDYHLNSKEKNAANGIDILKEIKKKNLNIPVIMLSSQKSYGKAAQTIMHGAIHYVVKGKNAFDEIYQLIKANL